jgi:hypothetical protein
MERVVINTIVIKEVATYLGLTTEQVKQMITCQSEYTRDVMESGSFDSVRWPYLGIFKSKPKEVQMLSHLKGLTKEQAEEFKKAVRTGKIRLTPIKEDGTSNN